MSYFFFFFFLNAGLSSMCHTQLLSCFLAFILCMQRHPLTINGNASSTYIYTTHGTKLLKMPLFPIITYEQHRDMLWSHPHILVPLSTSVLHRMMYEYNFFGLFLFAFLLEKHGFCTEFNHAVHKKAQLLTHLYNKTKQEWRTTFKHFPCLCCWVSEYTSELDCLWMFCYMAMLT